jgi:hypothetical protein
MGNVIHPSRRAAARSSSGMGSTAPTTAARATHAATSASKASSELSHSVRSIVESDSHPRVSSANDATRARRSAACSGPL